VLPYRIKLALLFVVKCVLGVEREDRIAEVAADLEG